MTAVTFEERFPQKPSDDFINHGFVLSFMDEENDRLVPIATVRLYDSDIEEIRIAYTGALYDKIFHKREKCVRISNRGARDYYVYKVDCSPPWGTLNIVVRRNDEKAAPHKYFCTSVDRGEVESCTIE